MLKDEKIIFSVRLQGNFRNWILNGRNKVTQTVRVLKLLLLCYPPTIWDQLNLLEKGFVHILILKMTKMLFPIEIFKDCYFQDKKSNQNRANQCQNEQISFLSPFKVSIFWLCPIFVWSILANLPWVPFIFLSECLCLNFIYV